MADRDYLRAQLAHVLGYYDFFGPPRVYPHAGKTHAIQAIAMHEQAHQWLTERSTVGLFVRHLLWDQEGRPRTEESIADAALRLVAETDTVQEGFASFTEYQHGSMSFDAFRDELAGVGGPYLIGFDTACKIESVLSPVQREYSPQELAVLSYCSLMDISRFALNLPIPRVGKIPEIVSYVQTNSPNKRWAEILERLSCEGNYQRAFLSAAKPMFAIWLSKTKDRFSNGLYAGIAYGDNVEGILSELFPHVPYLPVWEAWFVRAGVPGPERGKSGDRRDIP